MSRRPPCLGVILVPLAHDQRFRSPIRHLASVQSGHMNRASSEQGSRVGAALLATLFAVLFGFFAMHGVAAHGVGHGDGSHSTIPGVTEAVGYHAVTEGHQDGITQAAAGETGADHEPTSPEGHDGLGGEACVAMLILLIALIITAVRCGRTVRPMSILRRMRSRLILYARTSEPPCLHRLSIMRC